MISVLIPIYNYHCIDLVQSIANQCLKLGISFEIICVDDASSFLEIKKQNGNLTQLPHVQYTELSENIGRTRIRPLLAQKAQFDHLLFLDCDQSISSTFMEHYVQTLDLHKNKVIYGGRSYQSSVNPSFFLRWKYGRSREEKNATIRSKNPYKSFLTNNFLINKSLFNTLFFDENMTGYGYEDALISLQLFELKIPLIHIDNPAIHIGLETNAEFLKNSVNAMSNLHYLTTTYKLPPNHIRIYDFYKKLCTWRFEKITYAALSPWLSIFEKHLCSANPSLYIFDVFKLVHFIKKSHAYV